MQMPIGGYASNAVEKETIVTPNRVLLKIEEIQLHYGEDENNPRPFEVKDENGKLLFTSDPYVNALVCIEDDYGDGSLDGKKFWDKLYLSYIKSADVYAATKKGKLGRIFRTIPKYGPDCFDNEDTVYDEQDLVGHTFEAQTEQREDKNATKLAGTRIAYETIGAVPNRGAKSKGSKESEVAEVEAHLNDREPAA
jgi:hypothetical protein